MVTHVKLIWLISVLYSLKGNKWKLVDFGITSYATTDEACLTVYGRGTQGYRAPELLSDSTSFNKRSDIWALGCIFYELLTFGKKAFHSDLSVQMYSQSTSNCPKVAPPASIGTAEEVLLENDNKLLSQMLAREPLDRPRINLLRNEFESRCAIDVGSTPAIDIDLPSAIDLDLPSAIDIPVDRH